MTKFECPTQFTRLALAGLVLIVLAAPAAYGQRWEFGVGGGGSFYNQSTVTGPRGSAEASFQPGFNATAWLGQHENRRLGGEIRYTYQQNSMKLTGAGSSFSFGGRAHSVYYNALWYFRGRTGRTRPYASFGGGVKRFEGTGADMAIQPVGTIAVLTRTSEWKPLVSGGAGVRYQLTDKVAVRAELHGLFTQMPTEVITPVAGAKLDGWNFNFLPVFALTFSW